MNALIFTCYIIKAYNIQVFHCRKQFFQFFKATVLSNLIYVIIFIFNRCLFSIIQTYSSLISYYLFHCKTKKFDKIVFCSKPFLTSIFLLLDFFLSTLAFNHLINCTSYLLYQVYFLFLLPIKRRVARKSQYSMLHFFYCFHLTSIPSLFSVNSV